MALKEQSSNTCNIQSGMSTENPFEGKIVLEKTDFEKVRDLLNELAIHELAPRIGQKPKATGTPTRGFGGKGQELKVKKQVSDDEGGDNEEPEGNRGQKGAGKKGKGKKEESEDEGEDGDDGDGNGTDPDDDPDDGAINPNSNRLPPRVPTATEQPAVGHPDYSLVPTTIPVQWASMDRAVLMFPCSQSRAMKPWYMFRVYSDGTIHKKCDGHDDAAKRANPYHPWPYFKYLTRDRTHARREMTG